jgi:hypothetical protein
MNRKMLWRTAGVMILVLAGCRGTDRFRASVTATEEIDAPEVDIGYFYDRLAPYGDWTELTPYGWVWCPNGVGVEWRPYTDGHWVYTDDFGWLWDSDWDWGWACFHYGRWDWNDDLGWFWVPGYHWGPAWVAWRRGPNYIGWTPLPPQVRWEVGVGIVLDGVNIDAIAPRRWVFVEDRYFDAPRIRDHELLAARNVTIFPGTWNATRFEHIGGRVVNAGISVNWVESRTHRHIEHFRVNRVDNPAATRLPRERDGRISVFSPNVRPGREGFRPPLRGEVERRQQAERFEMQERQRAEESRQEERQRAEREPPRANREQLQRRQEAEREALRSEHERQSRELNSRQQRERERFQRPSDGGERMQGRPEERSRGR